MEGFLHVEGREQRNGREDEKSMMIVSYARVELTADVFEIHFAKNEYYSREAGSPGTVQARPRPPPTQSGSGSKMGEFRAEG